MGLTTCLVCEHVKEPKHTGRSCRLSTCLDFSTHGLLFTWSSFSAWLRFHARRVPYSYITGCGSWQVGIAGWRLDVAGEVEVSFWEEFRVTCEAARPDSILVGELIHGNYSTHVGPGRLHSCTNYQTSKAIWSSLNDGNYFELAHCVSREQDMYGEFTLLNFLGNHDTPRVCTRLENPAAHYPLAAAFLLTGGGVPCLYYGDEVRWATLVRHMPGHTLAQRLGADLGRR